jgi:large subunit ribosomal protein L31
MLTRPLSKDSYMKPEIHPEYREVLFHDTGIDKYFLIRSTLETTETREWEDGKTYPYYPVEISSASHPFYTGKHKIVDSGGRVDKFRQRYGRSSETEST